MKKSMLITLITIYVLALGIGLSIGKLYARNRFNNAMAEQINDVNKRDNKMQEIPNKNVDLIDKNKQENDSIKKENEIPKSEEKDKLIQQKEQTKAVDSQKTTEAELINKKRTIGFYKSKGKKVAYLTFDDGPSKDVTPKVLDILKENDIKATFFVLGSMAKANPELLKKIYEDGHAIANHSYSHSYKKIYSSEEAMIKEIKDTESIIKSILGDEYDNRFFRFPGGSGGRPIEIKEAIVKNGYTYIDWNCLTGDAEGKMMSAEGQYERFLQTSKNKNSLVILMHDGRGKHTTPDVLKKVIEHLKNRGYQFEVIK
ncbi:polysaccharide deacetylase family protein [Caloramator proteoclasticus]|uniref:Peptidoglycan/xylan/chitin deacetylase, PgdA/CDA1 family n=1 Tax=Caloramator proteoclasticus DSM 10124 TaxID=1121262 RepID=A0A1M4ZK77_9CLOT|nr:polysaccharide deacetylase family protein [Caloramator proteoclasticus]SHF18401.1 Peptidoglycan/xylan/chitin deacetylase, PgdA/CDA1 family [Caloramator proteoclasticus DSM 10124]